MSVEIKVKRKRVNWVKVLHSLNDPMLFDYFFAIQGRLHRGRFISANRCAYSTLKHHYSTTTINELVEKLGL